MANTRAISMMIAAMAAFAVTDALLKRAAAEIGVMQCLMLVSLVSLAAFLPLLWRAGDRLFSRKALVPAMLVRTAGEVVGSAGIVGALAVLPLSLVTALMQAQPLFLTAAAALFLGERVGWRRWSAVAAGFIGVLVILRPGTTSFDAALLLPLMGVLGLVARDLGTRLLPRDVSTPFAASWALTALACVGTFGMLAGSGWQAMVPSMWALVFAASASMSLAYVAITLAMREGEVSAVAPYRYTRVVFALLIAWIFFAERPDAMVWIGLAIIVGSGLYGFWRERQVGARVSA